MTQEMKPLRAPEHTAQRAEVAAVASAIHNATRPIRAVSDSRYTVDATREIITGRHVDKNCRQKDLWNQIYNGETLDRWHQMCKAHTTWEKHDKLSLPRRNRTETREQIN